MKKLLAGVCLVAALSGCGMSQAQLKTVNALLEQSKTVGCDEVHALVNQAQAEIGKKLDK